MLSSFILLILFFVDAKDFYSKNNLIKETQDEPAISREYFLGEYLIYDCEKGSFYISMIAVFNFAREDEKVIGI